jgi:uncharacterized membrane protein
MLRIRLEADPELALASGFLLVEGGAFMDGAIVHLLLQPQPKSQESAK